MAETDPPVVIVTRELQEETERMLAERDEDLAEHGVILERLAGEVDLSKAKPAEQALAELAEVEARIRAGRG